MRKMREVARRTFLGIAGHFVVAIVMIGCLLTTALLCSVWLFKSREAAGMPRIPPNGHP